MHDRQPRRFRRLITWLQITLIDLLLMATVGGTLLVNLPTC